ncbi:FtsX-like permease family protein [Streptomyces sp. NBC_00237]|uniref:FtsX-like permease family protein n=1 Tax=Streptomyces sp. NBC_00237 TaxID=2975687 RepID=UPI00225084F0|nr:FtsX-like permease family protein [Streptomyces sp. NBC_00237]MCX5200134.1 FtsX-like permease family protein [Streptomyces sp. NBC_00237]
MKGWYHSWLAAIRIARRDAWRSKGRSILVLAMIAVPILGVSAIDVTLRSAELTTEQKLTREMGAADALLTEPGWGGLPIHQPPDPRFTGTEPVGGFEQFNNKPMPEGRADATKAIPAGAKILTDTTAMTRLRTTHGLLTSEVREINASDPMAAGSLELTGGRFPEKAGEVIATDAFLKDSGLSVGSTLTARSLDTKFTVVGSYELPDSLKTTQVIAPPGTLIAPLNKALEAQGLPKAGGNTTYRVSVGGEGFTWNMVKAANAKGVSVTSRAVILSPPPDSDVPYFKGRSNEIRDHGSPRELLTIAATVVGMALLEVCLLAGPAFAVGARRSRRQLGLVGANGGDRRHIRAIVLSGGLVIGVAAAIVGTILGLLLTLALQPVLEGAMGKRFGTFTVVPLELLGIAAVAVLTGLLAAIVPAVNASRQTPLASLTGRRGVRRANRVLPVIGLLAVTIGVAIALYGATSSDNILLVAGGSGIAELGVVALTPVLVGLFGRLGGWLPLSPRLALRDAVRNRGRTAPAVAAVLAAVAGTVAVATYAESQDAKQRAEYQAMLPHGSGVASTDEGGGRDVPAVREAIQANIPLDALAEFQRIVVGGKNCTAYSEDKKCGAYDVFVPKANRCPLHDSPDGAEAFSIAERRKLSKDWRCVVNEGGGVPQEGGVLIGDDKVLKALAITDPTVVNALKQGKAVSFHKASFVNGQTGIKVVTDRKKADEARSANKETPGKIHNLPTVLAPESVKGYGLQLLVPPSLAKSAGFTTVPYGVLFSTSALPSTEQTQALNGAIDKIGINQPVAIESGYVSDNGIVLLALTVFAGLITIGAAGIATGLAQADAEADLKTLAAVGAPPRVRRALSGFQCGTVSFMGVVLGSAAGVLPAIALVLSDRRKDAANVQDNLDMGWSMGGMPHVDMPIVVPWETLGALIVVVPLGAALLAALVTRSRGALARREAG